MVENDLVEVETAQVSVAGESFDLELAFVEVDQGALGLCVSDVDESDASGLCGGLGEVGRSEDSVAEGGGGGFVE